MHSRSRDPIPIDPALLDTNRIHSGTRITTPQISRPASVALSSRASSFQRGNSPPTRSISEWGSTTSEAETLRARVALLAATVDDQDRRVAFLEHKLACQDALLKRLLNETGWEADIEEESTEDRQPLRKKNKPENEDVNRILTKGVTSKLTERQKRTRKELTTFVSMKLKDLSGIPHTSVVPPELPAGEHRLEDGRVLLIPNFEKDVTDKCNAALIDQASLLIFQEQTNEQTCDLRYKDVAFTEKDVEEIAKMAFKTWKAAHGRVTDQKKAEKAAQGLKKAARQQRRRQKKMDRLDMKEEYLITQAADPTPLLVTDWMSDYVSELEDGNQEEKLLHRARVVATAGLSVMSGSDDVIWERVRPAFRSAEINNVYNKLDRLRETTKRNIGKKKASHKRVDLQRVNNRIPVTPPYPFMVDEAWKEKFVDGKELDVPFKMKHEDPAGFGSKTFIDDRDE